MSRLTDGRLAEIRAKPDIDPDAAEELLAEVDALRAEAQQLREALWRGVEAMRLTREYVGEDVLPVVEGWSWFDWTREALAALAGSSAPETSGSPKEAKQ